MLCSSNTTAGVQRCTKIYRSTRSLEVFEFSCRAGTELDRANGSAVNILNNDFTSKFLNPPESHSKKPMSIGVQFCRVLGFRLYHHTGQAV